ncbi:Penicillin-insensitive transglycosylase / Transpeptidase-like module [Gammaproteobacteria bacterium]
MTCVINKKYPTAIRFVALSFCVLISLVVLNELIPLQLDPTRDLSTVVVDRDGRPLRIFLNGSDSWRMATDPSEVSANFVKLLLAYEDRRFFYHLGVDPLAVLRAMSQNFTAGRVLSGASTLTMQVARLLEPRPRAFRSKLIEALHALQLEARFSKREILAMYLSLAPYGGNIEGIRAAAMSFFGKGPAELTPGEAALLVALPRAPSRLRPDRWTTRACAARDKVLDRAVTAGVITPGVAAEAKSEPVPERRLLMPFVAPHLAAAIKRRHSGQVLVRTTLDGVLQRGLESLARREAATLHERASLALLVVDNRAREVLAYVSGPDFLNDRRNGYIDLVQSIRSPGSTLKPFIYGMGFDDGIIHPLTRLNDVSTRFGDYAPRNFNRLFTGELTVREALQRSLNIPAVLVLDKIGPLRFAQTLKKMGVRLVLPRGVRVPGLPVALGGASISLWDMTSLYVGLARDGLVAPLRVEPTQDEERPARLLAPESARQVLRILESSPPPPGIVRVAETRRRAPVALKTGTSYGFRDAWAFGVSGTHTVGVWVGRPDGTPSPDRYGRNTAAPLIYHIFDLLREKTDANNGYEPKTRPPELLQRLSAGDRSLSDDIGLVRLLFPGNDMVLEVMGTDGDTEPLILSASGGRRPLSWLVDGRIVATSSIHREVAWTPEGPGFSRITVVDADGRSDTVTVEIRWHY